MKRMFLLVFTLLLVGGAGATSALADSNPTPAASAPEPKYVPELPAYQAQIGDLIAIGSLIPGKLREVCAVVGFSPQVKPEMIGVFCYPSTKQGTPARNGYINIFLAWGKLTAPGGGRWTGTNLARLSKNFNYADYRSRGWALWSPPEAQSQWQAMLGKNGIYSWYFWPEPVFTKSQLAGKITKVISDQQETLGQYQVVPSQAFVAGTKSSSLVPDAIDTYGNYTSWRSHRALECSTDYTTASQAPTGSGRSTGWLISCLASFFQVPPYLYAPTFSEPWGPANVFISRYDPACGCDKSP